jgi:hypothetical protein
MTSVGTLYHIGSSWRQAMATSGKFPIDRMERGSMESGEQPRGILTAEMADAVVPKSTEMIQRFRVRS